MEATSDNWKPPFYLLEAHGFQTWLVNAKNVKHLPGRPKTDRLDAVGLCKVAERQMLRPNFVPPVPIRRLRDLPGTGRYDPATINDRLLLGLKGTMSEAELHFIRARLQGDCWPRPPAANSPCTYPPGWSTTRCPTSCWTPTPVYATRPRTCSTPSRPPARATATVKAFAAESLLFPARHLGGPHTGELYWKPAPRQCAVRAAQPRLRRRLLLRQRGQVTDVQCHHRTVTKPRQDWTTLIPGAHPGYISWEQFETNQATLSANAAARGEDRKAGSAREGPALLRGLVVCGKCGRRMSVGYHPAAAARWSRRAARVSRRRWCHSGSRHEPSRTAT
jgi:hypothetical protein